MTDVPQTHQTKPPASLRRLKNFLATNFVLLKHYWELEQFPAILTYSRLVSINNAAYLQSFLFTNPQRGNTV